MSEKSLAASSGGRAVPAFFLTVRKRAHEQWELLESHPEIAAPWHQLFRQVQSPRHVLSELLQNADDAGATVASAGIVGGEFVFEHDGSDFTADQLGSMCRFGFSNKRNLHTIGFRGVGFKSTFSLGNLVRVATPTLAFHFKAARFTEPVWDTEAPATRSTIIRVQIQDKNREAEVAANLREWSSSPVSLLFFRNIRKLTIDEKPIERTSFGTGPVAGSERIRLTGSKTSDVIVVRSDPEPFPSAAAEEIRRERSAMEDAFELPPCSVELVMGLDGDQRLYVILPTNVWTSLPFSCNAPFVQDPARTQIKSPAMSPTNQWLLMRLGRLAAHLLLNWVRNSALPMADRARAYGLLPKGEIEDHALGFVCAASIDQAFAAAVGQQPLLLASDGTVVSGEQCVAAPVELATIWTPAQIGELVGRPGAPVLASEVERSARSRLAARRWLAPMDHSAMLEIFARSQRVPRPSTLGALARLWHYVQQHVENDWNHERKRGFHIVPVENEAFLVRSDRVVRVSTTRGKLSEEDTQYLLGRLRALDPAWAQHVGSESEEAKARSEPEIMSSRSLLKILGFDRPTAPEVMALRAYSIAISSAPVSIDGVVRLTKIIALTEAQVPEKFFYVTRDAHLRPTSDGLSADLTGQLEDLLPAEFADAHLLHPSYSRAVTPALDRAWALWAGTPRSGLLPFVGIIETKLSIHSTGKLDSFLTSRGGTTPSSFRFKSPTFSITDYDFAPELLVRWSHASHSGWVQVVRLIAERCEHYLDVLGVVRVRQVSAQYTTSHVDCGQPRAAWIARLQGADCLRDTNGSPRNPADLLLRTAATEALLGVEPFVEALVDKDDQSKRLLRALGVRDRPTGLTKLIERLRALSRAPDLVRLTAEVSKWCNRIDQLLAQAGPEEVAEVRTAFESERLVPTDQGRWVTAREAYLTPDTEELAGLPLVHLSVRDLSMWPRVGVERQPSIEVALVWLRSLPPGKALSTDEARRVEAVLRRAPARVWSEVGRWLTLERSWVATKELKYRLTMQGLVKWKDLFSAIKGVTADVQFLPGDVCMGAPFSELPELRSELRYRTREIPGGTDHPMRADWVSALARSLRRVRLATEDETVRVRAIAVRLQRTAWYLVRDVRVEPCIGNVPVGEPVSRGALWDDEVMYVRSGSSGRTYRDVVEELSVPFGVGAMTQAFSACYERDPKWIAEYLDGEFDLTAEAVDAVPSNVDASPETPSPPTPASPQPVATAPGVTPSAVVAHPDTVPAAPPASPPPPAPAEPSTGIVKLKPKRETPSVMEEFARLRGYQWRDSVQRYMHPDGSWIGKAEAPFRWQRMSRVGQTVRRYWDTTHCLMTDGLEIGADVWELLGENPRTCSVIAIDPTGVPVELPGSELHRMKMNGELQIAVSRYNVRPAEGA